jgi:hypothetical protein
MALSSTGRAMASAIKSVVFMLPPRHILFDTEYIRHELLFRRNAVLRGQCWGVTQPKARITPYSPQHRFAGRRRRGRGSLERLRRNGGETKDPS